MYRFYKRNFDGNKFLILLIGSSYDYNNLDRLDSNLGTCIYASGGIKVINDLLGVHKRWDLGLFEEILEDGITLEVSERSKDVIRLHKNQLGELLFVVHPTNPYMEARLVKIGVVQEPITIQESKLIKWSEVNKVTFHTHKDESYLRKKSIEFLFRSGELITITPGDGILNNWRSL